MFDLRRNGWLVPAARLAQRHRRRRDDQRSDGLRRRDRCRSVSGSCRHSLSHREGCGPRARCLKDPQRGYFDPRDIYTALPKALIPKEGYAAAIVDADESAGVKPLAGMRIGIVREYMVKHAANDRAVSDLVDAEIKRVLRDELGAELVESFDPMYADDPDVANMDYNFQHAMAEIIPFHMPEYLQAKADDKPTYAVPGFDVMTRDYMVKAAEGAARCRPP